MEQEAKSTKRIVTFFYILIGAIVLALILSLLTGLFR